MSQGKVCQIIIRCYENVPEEAAIIKYLKSLPLRVNGGQGSVLKQILFDHIRNLEIDTNDCPAPAPPTTEEIIDEAAPAPKKTVGAPKKTVMKKTTASTSIEKEISNGIKGFTQK